MPTGSMTMKASLFSVVILLFLIGSGAPCAHGSQINWQSRPFATHQTSEGTPLDETYLFELGAFRDGFTPSAANTGSWASHWVVAARSSFNVANEVFGGSHILENNEAPFTTTNRGYIWGFATSGINEWVLISDPSWLWPETGDPLTFPEDWAVSTATEIIVGQVDPDESAFFLQTARIDATALSPRITGDQWLRIHFSEEQQGDISVSGWDRDPDGDGIDNLTEFALGTNPLMQEPAETLSLVDIVRVGGLDYLQLTVKRPANVTLAYTVEATSGFANWLSGPLVTETLVDTPNMLVVRDRTPIDFLDSRFLRLTVALED